MQPHMAETNSPEIEDVIPEFLDGELKERALGFVGYLAANQLTPQQWFSRNFWRVSCGKNYLCGIVVEKNRWRFWFWKGEYSGLHGENFVQQIHDHVRPCISCGSECPKGIDTIVFGKEFANTCFQFPVQFENPDSNALEHIKELIEYWKGVDPPSDAWHSCVE